MGEPELVARVKRLAGPFIDAVGPTTAIPAAFLGALTCGESGAYLVHNTNIPPRFESGVYNHLVDVQQGVMASYGAITSAMLMGLSDDDLRARASSWGFTQILGYHTLAWDVPLSVIIQPETHYTYAIKLMDEFARQYKLDESQSFEEMARCWNTGRPNGTTYDPDYVPNLLNRMGLWDAGTPLSATEMAE